MIKADDFKWLDLVYHLYYLGSYLCLSRALTDCFLSLLKTDKQVKRKYDEVPSRKPRCFKAMGEDIGWECLQDRQYTARQNLWYKIQHGSVDIESS